MKANRSKKIQFHYLCEPFSFRNRTLLKQFILKMLQKNGKKVDAINYIFCTDEYLLSINKSYLNHNTLTDIITFELSFKEQPLLSDIYISVDRVKENAANFKVSFSTELHRVIFHGALHLRGYKDKSASQAKIMRQQEDKWLSLYDVPREKKGLNINTFPVER